MRLAQRRVAAHRGEKVRERLVRLPLPQVHEPAVVTGEDEAGTHLQGAVEIRERALVVVQVVLGEPAVVEGQRIFGLQQ